MTYIMLANCLLCYAKLCGVTWSDLIRHDIIRGDRTAMYDVRCVVGSDPTFAAFGAFAGFVADAS